MLSDASVAVFATHTVEFIADSVAHCVRGHLSDGATLLRTPFSACACASERELDGAMQLCWCTAHGPIYF